MNEPTRAEREHLREQIFDLRKHGFKISAIARQLGTSRQRVSGVLKSGRATERKRGLGSAKSKTSRNNAKPTPAFSSGLHQSIFCVLQALRNTCLENGFRFYVNHVALKKSINDAFGLNIPVRTLLTYRFQSVSMHHVPSVDTYGTSYLPLSPQAQRAVDGGMHCEQYFGNAVIKFHDFERSVIFDRRNRLKELLHTYGTGMTRQGPYVMMPFFTDNPRFHPIINKRVQQRTHIKNCFALAENIKQVIKDLVNDPDLDVATERNRRELWFYFDDLLNRMSRRPYFSWRSGIQESSQLGFTTLIFNDYQAGFDAFLPLRETPEKGRRLHRALKRILNRIITMDTDLPDQLKRLSPGDRALRRKKLYQELMGHGWDSRRHPGNPSDNQLLHHR